MWDAWIESDLHPVGRIGEDSPTSRTYLGCVFQAGPLSWPKSSRFAKPNWARSADPVVSQSSS
jgi:hypothetical protein